MAEVQLDIGVPENLPGSLPVMALRRGVLLPMGLTQLTVGRARSLAALDAAPHGWILIAVQREPIGKPSPADLLSTATLARIVERGPTQNGSTAVVVQGVVRGTLTGFVSTHPFFEATWQEVAQVWPESAEGDAMQAVLREEVGKTLELVPVPDPVRKVVSQLRDQSRLVDLFACNLGASEAWLRDILTTHNPLSRAGKVLEQMVRARETFEARKSIQDRLETGNRKMQKDFVLRQQLKAIQDELGEGGGDDELSRLKERLDDRDLPEEVRKVVDREIRRMERMGNGSPEHSVTLSWLEWIADLPWGVDSSMDSDLGALELALDNSHYGLSDVKKQVLQYMSVRKLAGSGRADVLLLVGPPGVGKTSIGQAIADATGRKLVRIALGGVRDEAELRGHRRTYIGARPGRLVEGIRRAGTADPVVLLDEIDKLSSGMMGNPAAALLEILDPEQNHAFTDHYLEVPFDLSKVLFIATANQLSTIPGPLLDRMEVLHLDGYTQREKTIIAKEHLLGKVAGHAGLELADVVVDDAVISEVIAGWTREAGVRELQRMLGKLYRVAAVKKARDEDHEPLVVAVDGLALHLGPRRFHEETGEEQSEPGIATGLAWTAVGGDVLYVEASTLPGRGNLLLTGQLGDVMKESARAALTYVLAHAEQLGIDPTQLDDHDVHVHVPAGGVPKDGPSAGVTMFTALASLLSGRLVRSDTAMTGEATLRGRVLPVGGVKAKVLAAHRRGVKRVILPRRNGVDLAEIPAEVLEGLEILLVDRMDEVLELALDPPPVTVSAAA